MKSTFETYNELKKFTKKLTDGFPSPTEIRQYKENDLFIIEWRSIDTNLEYYDIPENKTDRETCYKNYIKEIENSNKDKL